MIYRNHVLFYEYLWIEFLCYLLISALIKVFPNGVTELPCLFTGKSDVGRPILLAQCQAQHEGGKEKLEPGHAALLHWLTIF